MTTCLNEWTGSFATIALLTGALLMGFAAVL